MNCEARWATDCNGRAEEHHHRLRRAQGGPDTPENKVWLCRPCHHRVHAYPRLAYEAGLLVHSWDGPPTERWSRSLGATNAVWFGEEDC